MIDKKRIPEHTYNELLELFGQEEAEKIIVENHYLFRAISNVIFKERLIRDLRLKNFRRWLLKKAKLSLTGLFAILIIIGFFVYGIFRVVFKV